MMYEIIKKRSKTVTLIASATTFNGTSVGRINHLCEDYGQEVLPNTTTLLPLFSQQLTNIFWEKG